MQKINVNKIYFSIGFDKSLKRFKINCYVFIASSPSYTNTVCLFSNLADPEHLKAILELCQNEKRSVLYLKSQILIFKNLSYFIINVIPGTNKRIFIEPDAIKKLPTLVKNWLKIQKGVIYYPDSI